MTPNARSRRRPHRLVAVAALLLAGAAGARTAAAGFACDQRTSLVAVGVNTAAGSLLLRAAGGPTRGGWLVAATPSTLPPAGDGIEWTETATYFPQAEGPAPYGGSIGPGPVFAVRRCGAGCLEAVRWEAGTWRPMGRPFGAPDDATVHATWDGGGVAWIVLHTATADGDGTWSRALHLDGDTWRDAGTLRVWAGGAAAAVPDPAHDDGVLSGTGRFRRAAAPETWVSGLPEVGRERRGVLVPVGGEAAAYVTSDGLLYLSRDAGARWVRTLWTPWGRHPTRIWTPGRDFTVDLPVGDRRGPLAMVWFDRRDPDAERLLLTEWAPPADWRLLAELAPGARTLNDDALEFDDFVALGPDAWLLSAGCVNTANGPGLVLRTYGAQGLTPARFLPLTPGAG